MRPVPRYLPGTALARFGRDLTSEARRGLLDPVIGRDAVMQRVMQVRWMHLKSRVAYAPGGAGGALHVGPVLRQLFKEAGCLSSPLLTLLNLMPYHTPHAHYAFCPTRCCCGAARTTPASLGMRV